MFLGTRSITPTRAAVLAWALGSTTACTLLYPTDSVQCTRSADCDRLGFEGMDCVDSVCAERPNPIDAGIDPFLCRKEAWPETSAESVMVRGSIVKLIGRVPYEGLAISACPSLDIECATPTQTSTSDSKGLFTIQVETGFRGHFFVPPPLAEPTLAPLKAHLFPPPASGSQETPFPFVVTDFATLNQLATIANLTIVQGAGVIFFGALDCDGLPIPNVSVTAATTMAETRTIYLSENGVPEPARISTSSSGEGALFNVPPGFVTIRGTHETEGLLFEQPVLIAADTITVVPIVPSPTP